MQIVQQTINELMNRILANRDLTMAMLVGCELEHSYDPKTETYTVKTKYPIGIVEEEPDEGGRVLVYEKRGEEVKEVAYLKKP